MQNYESIYRRTSLSCLDAAAHYIEFVNIPALKRLKVPKDRRTKLNIWIDFERPTLKRLEELFEMTLE